MAILGKINKMDPKKMFPILGLLVILIIILSGIIMSKLTRRLESSAVNLYEITEVTNGSLASSSILSGAVDASQVETITYDASKGNLSEIYVYEGQYVTPGDYILSYDRTTSSIDIETAQRSLNKAQRALDSYIATGGQTETQSQITTQTMVNEDGEEVVDYQAQQQQEYVNSVNYNTQLQNLQDDVANAQAELAKAENAAKQNILVTEINGKVIEVNNLVDTEKQNPVVVRIASDDLLVTGSLTEYDLASIKEGQKVEITSKVYPDKTWEGRISSISDFPEESSSTSGTDQSQAAKYKFYVKIDGDTSGLRKGFKMSMVIKDNKESQIVPLNSVITDDKKSYVWVYDAENETASKQEVKLGNADAKRREVNGLKAGQVVITNPNEDLEEGVKIETIDALENSSEYDDTDSEIGI